MDSTSSITRMERIECATCMLQTFSFGHSWLPSLGTLNGSHQRQARYSLMLHSVNAKGKGHCSGSCLRLCRQRTQGSICFHRKITELNSMSLVNPPPRGIAAGTVCSVRGFYTCTSMFAAAAWFKDKEAETIASAEQSERANKELLLFFFQSDLTTRLQRALNLDQYEVVQQLRENLVEVDREIARQKEARLGSASSKDEAQDKAITILRLRNDLQKAVAEENYAGAAELQERISELEAESLAASAKALAYQNVQYAFQLGQKVRHAKFGYRGVVCGMDPLCSESEAWALAASVQSLSGGTNQPFYQVLVDMKAESKMLVAYVAEENLVAPQEPDLDHFEHPYISFLFYGMDSTGDYIPIKQLREKYD